MYNTYCCDCDQYDNGICVIATIKLYFICFDLIVMLRWMPICLIFAAHVQKSIAKRSSSNTKAKENIKPYEIIHKIDFLFDSNHTSSCSYD